jgi:thioredoxin 1
MKPSAGKVFIVIALALAIAGVLYLKQQQAPPPVPNVTPPATPIATTPPAETTPAVVQPPAPTTTPKPAAITTQKPAPATVPAPVKTPAPVKAKPTPTHAKPVTPKAPVVVAVQPATLPRLLELGSDSCIPCKKMQPILAELRQEYAGKLQVDFIDVWKDESAGRLYGIEMIPTQIFFDAEGVERFRHVGFYPKEDIIAKLAELGVK